jgi:hypothetical protein
MSKSKPLLSDATWHVLAAAARKPYPAREVAAGIARRLVADGLAAFETRPSPYRTSVGRPISFLVATRAGIGMLARRNAENASVRLTAATTTERQAFCREVAALKAKAGQLGLFKTMHALEAGVTAAGYEVADLMEAGDAGGWEPPAFPNHGGKK